MNPGQEGHRPGGFGGDTASQTSDFRIPASRAGRAQASVASGHQGVGVHPGSSGKLTGAPDLSSFVRKRVLCPLGGHGGLSPRSPRTRLLWPGERRLPARFAQSQGPRGRPLSRPGGPQAEPSRPSAVLCVPLAQLTSQPAARRAWGGGAGTTTVPLVLWKKAKFDFGNGEQRPQREPFARTPARHEGGVSHRLRGRRSRGTSVDSCY